MMPLVANAQKNNFMLTHIPELLERFSLSYEASDDTCMGYFLYSKENSTTISRNLIVSHSVFSKSLYVSKFYPEIYREINSRYLSAACFYLIAHHAIQRFHLADNCWVNLETEDTVYDSFYSRLNDFDFKIQYHRPANRSYVRGRYHQISLGTEMITVHVGEI
ncbi:hypothetical protein HRM2_23750 [Desulforapulum autotrophicum HRM2]|uniref:Uncharacterized protein n=1 Tax=Desulforapulum autotrophicum (strain ATCC 43914 / DSM 3382 / VKM B-1955 / HRM2) TaxID=177437 RepID=C0QFQ2_DESAH|nr:hypothetical protein [Desulforapulum autotrophicum]ACN15470.1 hypothetical protein HRM2_23750 [Desulforapulum autotrophicum HRM2]